MQSQWILKELQKKNYYSFGELRTDFKWFIHNCFAIHRKNKPVVKSANQLLKILEDEIQNLTLCGQCYENEYNYRDESITMLCDPPHLLL